MVFIHTILGISTFPRELQSLSLKYFSLEVIVSGIYLSYAWISLYYLSVLDSFSVFGVIVAMGMLFGAILDVPLGVLTDRFGQKIAFCGALFCLMVYYLGLILVTNPIELVFLEILVGIYSALLSGSFISWFLNSWESIAPKESGNSLLFRSVMGNISFAKSIVIALATFTGGILLQQARVLPQFIFLIQAFIAAMGVIFGVKFISKPKNQKKDIPQGKEKRKERDILVTSGSVSPKFQSLINNIKEKYSGVIPYFISFSLLSFTSISFSSLVFSPLLYEIGSSNQTFNQTDIVIQYTTLSLVFITLTQSFSNVIFAFFSRLSGKMTSFIQSSYKGVLIFYILDYPVIWMVYLLILLCNFPFFIKLSLIMMIFFLKIILSGLAIGLYWQLYYKITSSEIRSSQESLFNTINLILSLIGFGLIGTILDSSGFVGALLFLLIISGLGILSLIFAKNPDNIVPLEVTPLK